MTSVRLLLSDVDGTLVTHDKVLTPAAIEAVRKLREAGVLFAITSARPPRGLTMYLDPLAIDTPIAAFNGGLIVNRDLETLHVRSIDPSVGRSLVTALEDAGLSVWVYQGTDWFVHDLEGPHVAHESAVCQFSPTAVADFHTLEGPFIKVVGVSDDPDVIARVTNEIVTTFGAAVSATNSQTYYIDVTHQEANKGFAVEYFSRFFAIAPEEIATIGDMTNDVLMFEKSGISIAVGNATEEVKSHATYVSQSNEHDGFAYAVENFILT